MRLLNIESSPRGLKSASIAISNAFIEAYRRVCPEVLVDTLNVWDEKLPNFDQEVIGAKYKGVNKEPMDPAERAPSGTRSKSWRHDQSPAAAMSGS